MNQQTINLLQIVASYIIVLGIAFFGINFMSSGFLIKFIATKISRGKKTLVEVHDVGGVYYRTGIISDGILNYKNRKKEKKELKVENADIQYRMGLKTIATDAIKNSIIRPDGSQVEGFDAIKFDNLLVRCLTSPKLQDQMLKIIIVVVVIILLISLGNIALSVQTKSAMMNNFALLNAKYDLLLNASRVI